MIVLSFYRTSFCKRSPVCGHPLNSSSRFSGYQNGCWFLNVFWLLTRSKFKSNAMQRRWERYRHNENDFRIGETVQYCRDLSNKRNDFNVLIMKTFVTLNKIHGPFVIYSFSWTSVPESVIFHFRCTKQSIDSAYIIIVLW